MADIFKACTNRTWIQGILPDAYGAPPPSETQDEIICATGNTREAAIEALEKKKEDTCPWWLNLGLINCWYSKTEVTEVKYAADMQRRIVNFFK